MTMACSDIVCICLQQYWVGNEPYRHIPVAVIAERFKDWKIGKRNAELLAKPFPKESCHPAALVKTNYALGSELAFPISPHS